jgi:hypothetical protein
VVVVIDNFVKVFGLTHDAIGEQFAFIMEGSNDFLMAWSSKKEMSFSVMITFRQRVEHRCLLFWWPFERT